MRFTRREFNRMSGLAALSPLGMKVPGLGMSEEDLATGGIRTVVSLNGEWEVEDSVAADEPPKAYTHNVPVPGLTHSAIPAFPNVDQYLSRELLSNMVRQGKYSRAAYDKLGNARGISLQKRNYFWYRRVFHAPRRSSVAVLKINKAQFGILAYLNGIRVGQHDPCFTAAHFDITDAIHWDATNELVIRIGAHPGILPANVSQGTDFEKNRWTPGIYDDVALMTMDNPAIANVQVAPRITDSAILVQTELRNYAHQPIRTFLRQQVTEWKSGTNSSEAITAEVEIPAGETRIITQTVNIPEAHLWSPEDPFLYQVSTCTSGDQVTTRFGMREFQFDTTTQRAYLNGRPYFLRGSNITLHRFFEDPESGTLPWNEAWLHRLLVVIPKQLHWNAFRFCIGPVPDRWLEIADEAGLLIQNEYMVWTGYPAWRAPYHDTYDTQEIITEYREWVRDNWNHPSVAIWDATNESWLPQFTREVIPAVRSLDLSNRPWENSYNAPAGPDDPVEDHQYLFQSDAGDPKQMPFQMPDLEPMLGPPPNPPTSKTAHAMILNEYGWLWLNRDGTPTLLTGKLYPRLLGERNTPENRFALQAYLLAGETEFWRAYRRYAGVLHFVYLTSSEPESFTADNFRDVKTLELNPYFLELMEHAFHPLGIYLNFWNASLVSGEPKDFTVAMVNDEDRLRSGDLQLSFIDVSGNKTVTIAIPFSLPAFGAQSYLLSLTVPQVPGSYSLQAVATPSNNSSHPVISRRNVLVRAAAG